MHGGSETVRALAVGESATLATAAASLERAGVCVDGPCGAVEPPEESTDCLLVDDVDAVAPDRPVVLLADDVAAGLEAGADEVCPTAMADDGRLLADRLRRALRCHWGGRTLLADAGVPVAVVDPTGRPTYVSPAVERATGYDADAIRRRVHEEAIHPADRPAVFETFRAVRDGPPGSTGRCEYRFRNVDGDGRFHETTFTNRLEEPAIGGVVASIRDLTDRRRVWRAPSTPSERSGRLGVDPDGRIRTIDRRASSLLGVEPAAARGVALSRALPEPAVAEAAAAVATGTGRRVEVRVGPADRWLDVRVRPSGAGLDLSLRDVTERVERGRMAIDRAERLETLVENVPVILFALDPDGRFTVSEGRGLERIDLEPGEIVGESLFEVYDDQPEVRADARRALDGEAVHSHRTVGGRVFETWYRPIVTDGELGRVIGVGADVTERVRYERALGALGEATGRLLSIEAEEGVYEHVRDVAVDALDLEATVVYRFDERTGRLTPAAASSAVERWFGGPPRLDPGESAVWEAFVDGTPRRLSGDRVPSIGAAADALVAPFGDHGVFLALSGDPGTFDGRRLDLCRLLSWTAEAALDRIGRTRTLRSRERELQRQNARLERLNRAASLREDVVRILLRADSRQVLECRLCERIEAIDDCAFVWIGELGPGGGRTRPRASAGDDHGYLEAVSLAADGTAEPTGRAARLRAPVRIDTVGDAVRERAWRTAALSRGFHAVLSVPLIHDGHLHGVLSAYAGEPGGFGEVVASTIEGLAEPIAYALDAIGRENGSTESPLTELEFELEEPSPLGTFADRLDAPVRLEGVVPADDDATVLFLSVGRSVEPPPAVVDGLEVTTTVHREADESLLRVRLLGPFVGHAVRDAGCELRGLSAEDGTVRVRAVVPAGADVRGVVAEVSRRGPAVSLVARREGSGGRSLVRDRRGRFFEALTDRQREVLEVAHRGGFFEWPRTNTGEELADSLGISPPAFHNHVRAAERKLFGLLFDGEH